MHLTASAEFRPFSATHALVVVVFVVSAVALVMLGRRLRQNGTQRTLDCVLAAIAFIGWLIINAWGFLPQNFDSQTSWPLHFCDLVALMVPFVLIRPRRWMRAVLYYWGMGLCTQGFITPGIDLGPRDFGFWTFWANHYIVIGASIYDLFARGYRPGWGDFFIASSLAWGYVALILPLNLSFDWNYGYVGPGRAEQPSLLDHVGPWPQRLPILIGMGYVVMVALTLPWILVRRTSKQTSPAANRPGSA